MFMSSSAPKSIVYALLAIGVAVLAGDFLLVFLPLSGWVLQSVLVGVYFEYLGTRKTVFLVAIMEVFFVASYGGATAVVAIASLFGAAYFLPLIALLYLAVVAAVLVFGRMANYVFHKIRLFERINKTTIKK